MGQEKLKILKEYLPELSFLSSSNQQNNPKNPEYSIDSLLKGVDPYMQEDQNQKSIKMEIENLEDLMTNKASNLEKGDN